MVTAVLDRPVDLPFIHRASFIRDRLRQVRQELTMQADSFSLAARLCAVDLLEVCTRFHITVEHKCCELGLRNLPLGPPPRGGRDSHRAARMCERERRGDCRGLFASCHRDRGVWRVTLPPCS